jgi:hypothetical protein
VAFSFLFLFLFFLFSFFFLVFSTHGVLPNAVTSILASFVFLISSSRCTC